MSLEVEFNNDNPDFDVATRRHEIQKLLSNHQCEITFTKVDGTVRNMPCTLMTEALPARDQTKLNETRESNPNTLSVWCLDKSEWRSFRVANVTRLKILN